ncbi:MAG: hypothetical protein HN712_01225 [Gemmatimonadetes bacterium]|jgi:hypothetical protein|nr:hypothetical protein [Gemmatimonadota bacterium]MBT6146070.1 hypothetical protein [Gemmatimonadota bacterium]MBT7858893.1 hypothetical protein [Gemmatimonadota bacterium]
MTYTFDWVSPVAPLAWDSVQLRNTDPYGDHLRPLYNLQEDVAVDDATDPVSAEDDEWRFLWQDLAGSLEVDRFALVAAEAEQLTGCIRFLPKPLSRPRFGAWSLEQHRTQNDADTLWIGAAGVDLLGYEQDLPRMMMMMLIEEARRRGFKRLQALAWSDVPVYALWGQAFPWSVYEATGFRSIADTTGTHLHALPDMLAGHHGGIVQELATVQLERAILTPDTAEQFAVVECPLQ